MAIYRLLSSLGARITPLHLRNGFLAYALLCVIGWPILAQYKLTRDLAELLAPLGLHDLAFRMARADEIQDRAAEGQNFGTTLRESFQLPSVNSSSGEITLHGGAVEGVTLPQSTVYPGATPGSMDGAAAAFGDHSALGSVSSTTQADLEDVSNSTPTANAWRTLRSGALNHSHPDMTNDPIATRTRDVLRGTDGTIDSLFTGCTRERTTTTNTSSTHVPDLHTCNRVNEPTNCTVRRVLNSETLLQSCTPTTLIGFVLNPEGMGAGILCEPFRNDGFMLLGFKGSAQASYTHSILVPTDTTFSGPGPTIAILSGGGIPVFLGNIYTSINHFGCDAQFNCRTDVTFDYQWLTGPTGPYTISVLYEKPRMVAAVVETIYQDPPGCLDHTLCSPGVDSSWVSSGSLLDQASTNVWQCEDADTLRPFGTMIVTPSTPGLGQLYPGAPAMPPSPVCYRASVRQFDCDFGTGTAPLDSCEAFSSDPSCAYLTSACLPENQDPVTGHCYLRTDQYDCGYSTDVMQGSTTTTETVCASPIRCLGNDCVTTTTEQNPDFGQATAQLTTLQQMKMDNDCTAGECKVFIGKPYTCKVAFYGTVDCCEQPTQVSMTDYVQLAYYTYKILAETVLKEAATTAAQESLTNIASDTVIDAVSQSVSNWVTSTFGPAALSALSTVVTVLVTILSVVMWVYMVYQFAMIIATIIWECTDDEFELAVKRELKNCVYVGEYCANDSFFGTCLERDSAYCCFNSPLARIIQEQVRPQLGRGWGTPEIPDCGGLTISELNAVDWSQVSLAEWLAILNISGLLPSNATEADAYWNRDNASRDPSPSGPQGPTINERVDNSIGSPTATPSADRETERADNWSNVP